MQKDRTKIDSGPSLVLFSLRRCLRTRFSMILSQIREGFCMFFGTFSWHLPCQKTCDRSSAPAAERLFGAHVWHTLGTKSAMNRITHPQHSFSKGGGFAKRPQFAVPQRGAGVVLNGSVKSPVPEGLPFLTFPAASARPPTLPCKPYLLLCFRFFSIFSN